MGSLQPSQEELDRRKIIGVNPETITNTESTDFPGHWPGEDNGWDIDKFRDNLKIHFHYNKPLDASFSLIGIDAALANAFRRILIAEVPTLAIEYVYVHNNTSIIQDEVLAQRLGLIPLKGSVEGINSLKWYPRLGPDADQLRPEPTDQNTVVGNLVVECQKVEDVDKDELDSRKKYIHGHVYARDLEFQVTGIQSRYFNGEGGVKPVNPDILIAKLRPGQAIDVALHCIKGVGADHAKFSPVATATYRLLPKIDIMKPIIGAHARKFQKCFPSGVIGLNNVTAAEASKTGTDLEGKEGEDKAFVKDAFKDTVSRECLRHEEFQGKVKLGRVRDHFIFSIESTGQFNTDLLFLESVKILKFKAMKLQRELANYKG